MQYKGIELKEITSKAEDFQPHKMLCWSDKATCPLEEYVVAIVKRSDDMLFITDHSIWSHGAEIPEEPRSRRATNRELARWLAQGNGECTPDNPVNGYTYTSYQYCSCDGDSPVDDFRVRNWEDSDWHEPTARYMGLEENK